MSGIGWAMGMERLIIACEAEGINLSDEQPLDAYVLCLSDKVKTEALQITTMLRSNGYRVDTDYQGRSFKAQFKTVDRMKAKTAILVGEKDIANNSVTIKEIATQTSNSVALDDIITAMDELFAKESHCHCGEE